MSESSRNVLGEMGPHDDEGATFAQLSTSLNDLRSALLALKPSGPDGFEGLLATVLSKITGSDFRVAKSGLQNGKDGATLASERNYITFEAKRYDGKINDNEVLTKVPRLTCTPTTPDVWVLGATTEVGTQTLEPLEKSLEKEGVGLLLLDWPNASATPPLAVVCALAKEETSAFLRAYISDPVLPHKAEAALLAVQQADAFSDIANKIVQDLKTPSLAEANAKLANAKWLETAFADRRIANAKFGQALTPKADGEKNLRRRSDLVQQIHRHLQITSSFKIIALIGEEGCGKSWLAALSWLELSDRPILVLIPAADLKPQVSYEKFTDYLISKFIEQTGDSNTEKFRNRWERRLQQWKEQPNETSTPRFILCVDGLNQQPKFRWSRWLDEVATNVEQLGGSLIITSREKYFNLRVRDAVASGIAKVKVPEWTEAELKEILAAKDIDYKQINPSVFARLRNPRLLDIAFKLLDKVEVFNFNELSVERLLFEYIRIGPRDGNEAETAEDFSERLATHAQAIIKRVEQQQIDDRLVFKRTNSSDGDTLNADLLAVAGKHFYQPLLEDTTRYTITDEGLPLALGLAIIKALQKAERNGHDTAEALDKLIEPIKALDKTAEAIFSGIIVSSIDKRCSSEIKRRLICSYLRLQNINMDNYPAFATVARKATDAAMWALFDLSTTPSSYAANKDWLSAALHECRQRSECWPSIKTHVSNWLRTYSLDPKLSVMSTFGHAEANKIAKETEEKTLALEKVMKDLSVAERTFLEIKMRKCEGYEPSQLWDEAFKLLAGMPLESFAEQLVAYSFSYALNSSIRAPYDEFLALIRFNRKDWQKTRQRLLETSKFLSQEGTSRTGRWALATILKGTCTAEDAEREAHLVESLTKDMPKFEGWRLIEDYCASDPCDPASTDPDNIDTTAEKYSQIQVNEVFRHRSTSKEDFFVREALPGLARFRSEIAIETLRKISRSIVGREPSELMLGITSLEQHCALLKPDVVHELVEIAKKLSSQYKPEPNGSHNNWIALQIAILIAFPHLNGEDQLNVLVSLPSSYPPTPDLAKVLKPAAPKKLEDALSRAIESDEDNLKVCILLFARHSGTDLTNLSRKQIGQLAENESSTVRALAMDIIADLNDADLIKGFVNKVWDANLLDPKENYLEAWYGSLIVINAAKQGMISVDVALNRISPLLFSVAVKALGEKCHAAIARRLTAAVISALDYEIPFIPPAVEQSIDVAFLTTPPYYSLTETKLYFDFSKPDQIWPETPEVYQSRQQQSFEAFHRFQTGLTKKRAQLIIDDAGFEAINAFVSESTDHCIGFVQDMLRKYDGKLASILNFALSLARAISYSNQALACELFTNLSGKRAFVSRVYGLSRVTLEAISIWKSADGVEIDDLRTFRLDHAVDDHQLAQEVLAALMSGKAKFLEEYVHKCLERPEPAVTARALMVVGFGAETAASETLLNKYISTKGLIGNAAKSAQFAYDRNRWAKYWYEKMRTTNSAEEFWAYSILFLKVVDARFGLWRECDTQTGSPMSRFAPSLNNQLEKRSKAWKGKREKTLCGMKAPEKIYIESN